MTNKSDPLRKALEDMVAEFGGYHYCDCPADTSSDQTCNCFAGALLNEARGALAASQLIAPPEHPSEFWIDHPSQSSPVSLIRWAKWCLSQRLARLASRWEEQALYPNGPCPHCGRWECSFGDDCDGIPF